MLITTLATSCASIEKQACDNDLTKLLEPMAMDGRIFPRKVLNTAPTAIEYLQGQRLYQGRDAADYFSDLEAFATTVEDNRASSLARVFGCLEIPEEKSDRITWLYNTADSIKTLLPEISQLSSQFNAIKSRESVWLAYASSGEVRVEGDGFELEDALFLEDGQNHRAIFVLKAEANLTKISSLEPSLFITGKRDELGLLSFRIAPYPSRTDEDKLVLVYNAEDIFEAGGLGLTLTSPAIGESKAVQSEDFAVSAC